MDISTSFKVCGSGLAAQRTKMDIIASNLANADVTRTADGGPYRKKIVVLSSEPLPVKEAFDNVLGDAINAVKVAEITEDTSPPKMVHNPSHPDANANGYIALPNVNVVSEMAEMIIVSRAFEAMATAFDATKNMALKTLEIGK
jgi:flagellar basal-body rod protein FlgC